MKVSIIVPIYNASKYLKDCLCSIQNQEHTDFEVICVDDGSTDNSADIALKFSESDKRFKLYSQLNSGVSAARNTGLKHAKGEYICFLDADDCVSPYFLEHLIELSSDNSFAICSFTRDMTQLGQGIGHLKEYSSHDYIHHVFNEDINHPNIWMMLFKSEIIRKNNLSFTVGCIKNEDTEFYIKYLVHEDRVKTSSYKGYYYRMNPNSVMNSGINMQSLTSIEAQGRISDYLVKANIYDINNYIVSCSVQAYVWGCARYGQREVYNRIHSQFYVSEHMKKMLKHPRLRRKIVALLYLSLGRNLFFSTINTASKLIVKIY